MIDQSDFGVSIVSDVPSEAVSQEVLQMKESKIPVFQVSSGSASDPLNNNLQVSSLDQSDTTGLSNLINVTLNTDNKI